ncbi:DMT family transporter [Fulvimarina sp. MAC3]|uniref:DMT family transporter n=1 Tax=Fulvimarina sp. MAC3 TaxID=3148887 RepID=UPI0031FCC9D0
MVEEDGSARRRTLTVATLIVVATGALWGFYWYPVRRLDALGLSGAWGSLAIVASAVILLMPVAFQRRRSLKRAGLPELAALAIGGAAFVFYSVGFVYGRVAIIILLFFLTPVWSTLIGRFVMGWPITGLRIAALVTGLAGLAVMLGANGEVPIPRGMGEWLALLSGILWSISTTGMRANSSLGASESAFVFAFGGMIGAFLLAPTLEPFPSLLGGDEIIRALGWAVFAGPLWWGLSMAALIWAASRLEPARVGILLMAEVLIGALSAAWLAGEELGSLELAGGALVLIAGGLEVWPRKTGAQPSSGK